MATKITISTSGLTEKFLRWVEIVGNRLPDPAMLFLLGLITVWILSAIFASTEFTEIDPRSGDPLEIINLLTGEKIVHFTSNMVNTFVSFAPFGIVLVSMLGVGVAEHSGYINAGLKMMLNVTPKMLLTPMVITVGIVSHTAVDVGFVVVIPLGGIIFHAAGRHPLAGIAAAFAGVAGGFSANFVPSAVDPLLQGFTQAAAQIIDPAIEVNPLCNYYFTASSSILIILAGWFLTDKVVEKHLAHDPVDADADAAPQMDNISPLERKAFWIATATMLLGLIVLFVSAIPADSPLRDANGSLDSYQAPIIRSIVPLIFLLFLVPGAVYGFVSGTFTSSKDIVDAMTKAMSGMSYYIAMVFFCSLFIAAFAQSNIGALLALKGASFLRAMEFPGGVTVFGIIVLTAFVNLFLGSASAKWALLGPIFVPMLMQVGISPDLTQAAYRIGDSSSNIVTPLMPYFPLVVVYCQKYMKQTGIGTLVSMMLPYSITYFVLWSAYLLIYWAMGIPLGLQAGYSYP